MKLNISFISAVILLTFISCGKKDTFSGNLEPEQISYLVSASFNGDEATKTTLNNFKPLWAEGDQIMVYNGDGSKSQTVTLSGGGTPSTSLGVITGEGTGFTFKSPYGGTIYAVYPASSACGVSEEDNRPVINIPDVTDGKFSSANICVATATLSPSGTNTMLFKNVVTILQINDKTSSIKKFIIGQESKDFCGKFEVDGLTSDVVSLVNGQQTGSKITVKGMTEGGPYYMAIAPLTVSAGVLAKYYREESAEEDANISSKSLSKETSLAINKIYRLGFAGPAGSIGVFSVSDTKKVSFAPGNLYYDQTVDPAVFRFEARQTDYRHHFECNASDNAACIDGKFEKKTPENTVGSFKWGSLDEAIQLQTAPAPTSNDFFASDNVIVEGATGTWSTLSEEEYDYLFMTRKVKVNEKDESPYGQATVNGVKGLVILPDNWDGSVYADFKYGKSSWISNTFTESTWSNMEKAGCVFLPTVGYRQGKSLINTTTSGHYWSSTLSSRSSENAITLYFNSECFSEGKAVTSVNRSHGRSVRLVQE